MGVKRFEVYLVNLDPAVGSEIRRRDRVWVVCGRDEPSIRTVHVAR